MQNKNFWENYGFVERGKLRKKVLFSIDQPKTPSSLSKELKIHLAEASRALLELSKKGLVECLTPNLLSGRVYGLTKKGKEVLDYIKKIKKN